MPKRKLYHFAKRSLDVGIAATSITLLSPLFAATAIAIRLDSPGPVFYKQRRVGQLGACFKMWKFRSMHTDAEQQLIRLKDDKGTSSIRFKMQHDPRVTRVGRIIRKLSVDELPQLWNVLTGDLTLVGPRPPLVSEVITYTLYQQQRLQVKPGLTCIWQVSGRSDVPFLRQVEMDLTYIRKRSFLKDIWLIAKTIPAVVMGKGAY
ncbi:MAG: sugar transferase [Pseudomonadota bacterium]